MTPPGVETAARDVELIAAIALGDEVALAELYDCHAGAMFAVGLRVLCNRADAEDLVHDVFVEAWQKAGDFNARRGSVRSWLLMRVRSRGIDRLRSLQAARRRGLVEDGEREAAEVPVAPVWDTPDRERARRALDTLPPAQRVLVELAYFQGLTCGEMARQCGIPLGTVKSRLSAAMSKLRERLAPPEEGDSR